MRHNFASGIAEANNFVPIVFCSGIGNHEGTEGDRNAAWIRQVRYVAQNLARASDPDRADRPLCFDGRNDSSVQSSAEMLRRRMYRLPSSVRTLKNTH